MHPEKVDNAWAILAEQGSKLKEAMVGIGHDFGQEATCNTVEKGLSELPELCKLLTSLHAQHKLLNDQQAIDKQTAASLAVEIDHIRNRKHLLDVAVTAAKDQLQEKKAALGELEAEMKELEKRKERVEMAVSEALKTETSVLGRVGDLNSRTDTLNTREAALVEKENRSQLREESIARRESKYDDKMKNLTQRETKVTADNKALEERQQLIQTKAAADETSLEERRQLLETDRSNLNLARIAMTDERDTLKESSETLEMEKVEFAEQRKKVEQASLEVSNERTRLASERTKTLEIAAIARRLLLDLLLLSSSPIDLPDVDDMDELHKQMTPFVNLLKREINQLHGAAARYTREIAEHRHEKSEIVSKHFQEYADLRKQIDQLDAKSVEEAASFAAGLATISDSTDQRVNVLKTSLEESESRAKTANDSRVEIEKIIKEKEIGWTESLKGAEAGIKEASDLRMKDVERNFNNRVQAIELKHSEEERKMQSTHTNDIQRLKNEHTKELLSSATKFGSSESRYEALKRKFEDTDNEFREQKRMNIEQTSSTLLLQNSLNDMKVICKDQADMALEMSVQRRRTLAIEAQSSELRVTQVNLRKECNELIRSARSDADSMIEAARKSEHAHVKHNQELLVLVKSITMREDAISEKQEDIDAREKRLQKDKDDFEAEVKQTVDSVTLAYQSELLVDVSRLQKGKIPLWQELEEAERAKHGSASEH